jgi:hypothetical protein
MRVCRSKWFLPLFAVALGLLFFVTPWIGGSPGSGLVSLPIMTGFGGLVLLGGRSETIRGLRGDGRDERFRQIDIHATAVAGLAVLRRSPSRSRSSWGPIPVGHGPPTCPLVACDSGEASARFSRLGCTAVAGMEHGGDSLGTRRSRPPWGSGDVLRGEILRPAV